MSVSSKLNAPVRDAMVELTRIPTRVLQNWMNEVQRAIPSFTPLNVVDFGASGTGTRNDTAGFQKAIDQAVHQGGGQIIIPPGEYLVDSFTIPEGDAPVTISGFGNASLLKRRSNLLAGVGMIDVLGSNVTLTDFGIDGDVTVPDGLFYNTDFTGVTSNDPMADSLTRNSSVWLHGGTRNFVCQRLQIQHTGGYAAVIDAGQQGISDVRFLECLLQNNRPFLFGITGGDPIYGSWGGGIYVNGDGRTANPGRVLKQFLVSACRFLRGTGNQLWSHLYGLDELHEDFQFVNNYFLDIGLDGILVGGVTGGAVNSNVFRRIGYTTLTDTDRSVPRWLVNLQATALDSSGLVKGVPYEGNSFLSVNGGCLDLDCHGDSSIVGNVARIPYPDEPEYYEDDIALTGPFNNASYSYGVNLGNTQNSTWGGRNVTISGNTFVNLPSGAVRLYAARDCLVSGNNIVAPDAPKAPPIALGPGGTGANQRSTGNIIKHNRFAYSPSVAAPFVFEDGSVAPFTASDTNYVYGNCPIIGVSGLATEFQKDPSSSSPVFAETVWFV